ncbi:PLDc N-terminal domain-containing protein [Kocuria nitroreducens]|uniref:PLDc N-terminal domain-containing protein n=1 Tax=Kocuria nitroreducens TaxID=3058914 RepID=UPI0036DD094B
MTTGPPMITNLGGADTNPLIPTSWEIIPLLLGAAVIVLFVVAVLSLSRDEHCTPTQRLLWLLVLLAAPVLGPLLWLTLGRHHALGPRNGTVR